MGSTGIFGVLWWWCSGSRGCSSCKKNYVKSIWRKNFTKMRKSKNSYLVVYGFAVKNRARWGMIVFADFWWWRRWFHEIIFRFHEIILWFFGIFATGASDHFWRFLIIIGISFINRRTCNFTKKLVISRIACYFTKKRVISRKIK